MRINQKYLHKPRRRKVRNFSDFQWNDPNYSSMNDKTVLVHHYHEPYKWNFYIEYLNDSKTKRRIWYDYNFAIIKPE